MPMRWNEFKQLDFRRVREIMAQPIIIDGRNAYDPLEMAELGFSYLSIGHPAVSARELSVVR